MNKLILAVLLLFWPAILVADSSGFIYSNGSFALINQTGAVNTEVVAVNGLGQIVGTGQTNFLDTNGTFTNFAPGFMPVGINNSGQIVFDAPNVGFLDVGGTLTPLAFPGAVYSEPTGTSNNGMVSGVYELPGSSHLQRWVWNGSFTPFNGPSGAIDTRIWGINDSGQIVGMSFDGSTNTNFLFSNGQFQNIGVEALAINDEGQMTGDVGGLGFIGDGKTFTTFSVPGALSTVGEGINDEGKIVGVATFPLPPTNVPEPSTLLLLACGIGLLACTFYRNFRIRES